MSEEIIIPPSLRTDGVTMAFPIDLTQEPGPIGESLHHLPISKDGIATTARIIDAVISVSDWIDPPIPMPRLLVCTKCPPVSQCDVCCGEGVLFSEITSRHYGCPACCGEKEMRAHCDHCDDQREVFENATPGKRPIWIDGLPYSLQRVAVIGAARWAKIKVYGKTKERLVAAWQTEREHGILMPLDIHCAANGKPPAGGWGAGDQS